MKDMLTEAEATAFLERRPETGSLELLLPDMNGMLRGKRSRLDGLKKLYSDGVRLPGSTYLLDATGENCATLVYGSDDGDPDYAVFGVGGSLSPVPWAGAGTAQLLGAMLDDSGSPFFADPRHVLRQAMQPLTDMGLRPVVAIELEFYLLDNGFGPDGRPRIATAPGRRDRPSSVQVYSMDDITDFEPLLNDIDAYCAAQGIPADVTTSEYGPGQFEINLKHVEDPVAACDHAVLFKRIVKAAARQHDIAASFMAKPFEDQAGSGMHVHVSLLDRRGRNIFAGPTDAETGLPAAPELKFALGGLKAAMAESMAIFAPNANSYRRFQPNAFVPVNTAWGTNNRTVALRIPHSDAANIRLEHRPAGADANPYLVCASVLAGIHHGLENRVDPGPIEQGNAGEADAADLPMRWEAALDRFAAGTILPRYLGRKYADAFAGARRYECDKFHAHIQPLEYSWYMRSV